MEKDPLNDIRILKKDVLDKQIKDPIQLQKRCKQIWQLLETEENTETLNQALSILNELIVNAQINPYFRAILTTTGGAIIETGKTDAMIIFKSTLSLFMTALFRGQEILKAKKDGKDSRGSTIDSNLQKKYPDATFAWTVLDMVCEPMKSMLIMSKEVRKSIKEHEKHDEIINFIISYSNYHEGCYWVYTTLHIMDGDILVFHPQSFRGYKIHVTDMIDPMILSHLCTKNLVGDPNEGFIPAKNSTGTTQFGLFNWKLMNYLYKEGKEPNMTTWSKTGIDLMKNEDAYIGNGSNMSEVLVFNNEIPILFLVDYGKTFNFEIHDLGKLKPNLELVEKMDRAEVETWFSKIRSLQQK